MPQTRPTPRPTATPQPPGTGGDGYRVRSAPYALVRATVLAHPAQQPDPARFRALLARLHGIDTALARATGPLCDELHDSREGHPAAFHREVVLPLRRALHNGREPRAALLARLGDLPARAPRLAAWVDLCARRAALLPLIDAAVEPALAAERAALSALCREPALAKAVALTSADLLRGVQRAGSTPSDRRTRKEEATVLRYALRASTKTSPLSWFTAVGWGVLPPEPTRAHAVWGAPPLFPTPPRAVVKVNRTLTAALTLALLDAPHRRAALPYRITSTARVESERAAYVRERAAFAGGRYLVPEEDEVELPLGGPLSLVTQYAQDPVPLDELTALLDAARGPAASTGAGPRAAGAGPRAAGAGPRAAVAGFLDRLVDHGLLVPGDPVPPQAADPLSALAGWLRPHPPLPSTTPAPQPDPAAPAVDDRPGAEDAARAERILRIGRDTAAFADTDAGERPALLAALSRRWAEELAAAGRPVPGGSAPLSVLSEDVIAPDPLPLDGFLGPADHEALGEATALAELHDLGHLVRRVVRDRFVRRYGPGGTCPRPWEFGAEFAEAWESAAALDLHDPDARAGLPDGLPQWAALRSRVAEAAREAGAGSGTDADRDEIVLPADLVRTLGDRLPGWATQRPLSYAYFLQRDPEQGLLCVNHVYGGWGRFTSRFLDSLDPRAAAAVSRQVRSGLAPGARAAQIRPVGGFNANLHPLLVPDEIGPDHSRTSLSESDLDLVHDEATDQVRFRVRAGGELLDVLYPGFLAPVLLPRRIGAHLGDHPHGAVDLRPLTPRRHLTVPGGRALLTPRLRHRHVVLRRRRWTLPPGVVGELRADLLAGGPVPARAAARWRALLDLPEQVFLHPTGSVPAGRPAGDFLQALGRPKPQFVDLGNALHLRCLAKWLSRHADGAVLEEALPAPGGLDAPTHAVELVLEVYRAGRAR
ncbi:lantibiotic dehydratase [Streptomyces sp. cmx-4-9]|uniref:lantibiotic dehydratase n=1 Tax=Streptomyces sp. cmx-4-9 TaxID=2790941 RepID=UPI00397EC2A6